MPDRKRLPILIVILLALFLASYFILRAWQGTHLLLASPSRENFLRSIRLIPSSPDPYHRMSLFHEWEMKSIDSEESLRFLKEAIERNPFEQRYWLNLAQVLHLRGDRKGSEQALEKAIWVFPTGYRGRWVTGTLLLQQGALDKALPHLTYILSHYPNRSRLVYEISNRAIADKDLLLEKLIPKDSSSIHRYIGYLCEIGDDELARKAWQKKVSYGFKSGRAETIQYIEFLIGKGKLNEGFEVWKEALREEGLQIPSDGNLMTNGGFEEDKLLGGGFDWKIGKVKGAEVSFDSSVAHEGKRSLKIIFDGKENVNFYHVYQYVPLRPETEYLLKTFIRSEKITTRSGIKIEIIGIGPRLYSASESVTGDNAWKELTLTFRTPAESQGGLVRVRREQTEKLDRFIGGTVWIDDFQLKQKTGQGE
ncbi:MAG: carbohydrate binding domain-containing protein [Thermodesulfobacteriota bacterium]